MACSRYHLLCLSAVIFLSNVLCSHDNTVTKFPVLMPNVHVPRDDAHICTAVKMDPLNKKYVVEYEPKLIKGHIHHMILYGCKTPAHKLRPGHAWNCGPGKLPGMMKGDTCAPGSLSQVIYSTALHDSETLDEIIELPEDTGFAIGGDSPIQYLVLQSHYAGILPDDVTDNSGLILHLSNRTDLKSVGLLQMASWDEIQPHTVDYFETECLMRENKIAHPYAFRVHTHKLGVAVAAYHVRRDWDGRDNWKLLAKRNPQLQQNYRPVFNFEPILPGDKLALRCTLNNTRDVVVKQGPHDDDEMCMFYLMYWVDGDAPLKKKYCTMKRPPKYTWAGSNHFNNIPGPEEDF